MREEESGGKGAAKTERSHRALCMRAREIEIEIEIDLETDRQTDGWIDKREMERWRGRGDVMGHVMGLA